MATKNEDAATSGVCIISFQKFSLKVIYKKAWKTSNNFFNFENFLLSHSKLLKTFSFNNKQYYLLGMDYKTFYGRN
jgi:hypothetical protein